MLILYLIILVSLICCYHIIRWLIKKNVKKIEKYDKKITCEEMLGNVIKYLKENELYTVKLEYGNKYCFDTNRNVLNIIKKDDYSRYDVFVSYHEIGHIIDFKNHYKDVYKLIVMAKIIFYLLWIPILCIKLSINIQGACIQLLNLFEIVVGLFVLITTLFTEYHASYNAMHYFKDLIIIPEFKKLAKLSAVEQGLYWGIMVFPLILIKKYF